MEESKRVLKEIGEGIDGIVMLSQWQLRLATDLRKKVGAALGEGVFHSHKSQEGPGRGEEKH